MRSVIRGNVRSGRGAIAVRKIAALVERIVPTRELEVRRLFARDEEFRGICDDYLEAQEALRHWQVVEGNELRADEYRRLAAEFEAEIVAYLDAARARRSQSEET